MTATSFMSFNNQFAILLRHKEIQEEFLWHLKLNQTFLKDQTIER